MVSGVHENCKLLLMLKMIQPLFGVHPARGYDLAEAIGSFLGSQLLGPDLNNKDVKSESWNKIQVLGWYTVLEQVIL